MSDITKEEVELMLDNHAKSLELSNIKSELSRLQAENKDLVTKLSSDEEESIDEKIEETQAEVQEAVEDAVEEQGAPSELGALLEKVAGLEEITTDLTVKIDEISSKFKDVCSSIKTVTPLEAGVGKMSSVEGEDLADNLEASEDEVVDEVVEDEVVEEPVEEAEPTDAEVDAAIKVLETYFETVGSLEDIAETELSSKKRLAKRKALASRNRIQRKATELSSKSSNILSEKKEAIRRVIGRKSTELSSKSNDEYYAGELAGKLFSKNR